MFQDTICSTCAICTTCAQQSCSVFALKKPISFVDMMPRPENMWAVRCGDSESCCSVLQCVAATNVDILHSMNLI